jgi:hypothetical protein
MLHQAIPYSDKATWFEVPLKHFGKKGEVQKGSVQLRGRLETVYDEGEVRSKVSLFPVGVGGIVMVLVLLVDGVAVDWVCLETVYDEGEVRGDVRLFPVGFGVGMLVDGVGVRMVY